MPEQAEPAARRRPMLALVIGVLLCAACSTAYEEAVRHAEQPPPLFSSADGESAYLDAYDSLLASWPVVPQSVYVPTRFGRTHVLVTGPVDAPPLVLLHAVSVSSAAWFSNVGPLSKHFRVYAVDAMGDCGRSEMQHLPSERADYTHLARQRFRQVTALARFQAREGSAAADRATAAAGRGLSPPRPEYR
jgi:hypothetical protein